MRFCDVCDNMMFVKTDGGGGLKMLELEFECRNCNFVSPVTDRCIFENNYADDQVAYKQFMTKHIRHDVTLPRANNIPCPVCSPKGGGGGVSNVVFIKYDANLKFLYMCEGCGSFWKSGGGGTTLPLEHKE